MKPIRTIAALAATALLAAATTATAADLPKTNVKVVGNYSTLLQTKEVEIPFWTKKIEEDSNGQITVD